MSNTALNIQPPQMHGVYDMSIEEYHAPIGISRSGIMEFSKTPFHYYNKYLNKDSIKVDQKSPSMRIGGLVHTFILEPELFKKKYFVSEKMDKRTKAGKQYYESLDDLDYEIITGEEFEQVKAMAQSLLSNTKIIDLVSGAQYEKSLFWTDPDTGILCKARPDIWHNHFICDLKTAENASYWGFQKALYQYGFHIQCGMMYEAFKHIFNVEMRDFIFVVVENKAPYANAIYKLDRDDLDRSVQMFKKKLSELNQCYINNEWPSYQTQIITLPNYAIGE